MKFISGMEFRDYRLPDGRIVKVDRSAAKDARTIDYTLADGTIVIAVQMALRRPAFVTKAEWETWKRLPE